MSQQTYFELWYRQKYPNADRGTVYVAWEAWKAGQAQVEVALRLALDALNSCTPGDYSTGHVVDPYFDEKLVEAAIASVEECLK